jgi:hypothetical protein
MTQWLSEQFLRSLPDEYKHFASFAAILRYVKANIYEIVDFLCLPEVAGSSKCTLLGQKLQLFLQNAGCSMTPGLKFVVSQIVADIDEMTAGLLGESGITLKPGPGGKEGVSVIIHSTNRWEDALNAILKFLQELQEQPQRLANFQTAVVALLKTF